MSTSSGKPWVGFTCQFALELILFKKAKRRCISMHVRIHAGVNMRAVCMLPSVLLTWIWLFQAKQNADTSANTREMKDFFFPPRLPLLCSRQTTLWFVKYLMDVQYMCSKSKGWLWFNHCKVRLSCVLFKTDYERWQTQNTEKVLLPAHFLVTPLAENNTLFSWTDGTDLMYPRQPFGWR